MHYVKVETTGGGSWTDPRDYLDWLGEHADELPPGARAFATHPEHYDFSHQWCPRSASFDRMSTRFTDDGVVVTLVLAAYGGAPPEFVLRYEGVRSVESDGDHSGQPRSNLLVDEILPDGEGVVRHELAFTGGTITVVATDLTAGWSGPGAPEDPRDRPDRWLFDNPATLVHHLRLRRSMFVSDDSFSTLAAFVSGSLWTLRTDLHGLSRWLTARLGAAGRNITWESHIVRHVAGPGRPDVRSDELTVEENEQACTLALDLLAEWLGEQGYVAE
ncbi:hypothetical protein [Myceligenerans pegani]|uniref:Uncharacterized protein n=1 Tax=Myceligenerans pegani TaxID=2776917 RepID=A0ABR9MWM1_9MICO|nr:hypothetical protein [Myceligenerans sp. TRM 65318]MBE1875391.1 hypothetical protein [Myceligenerans sp. TRM 65318]MBE3017662.1 hypothetical protein [Myceligenerans sp. TRM 65318]